MRSLVRNWDSRIRFQNFMMTEPPFIPGDPCHRRPRRDARLIVRVLLFFFRVSHFDVVSAHLAAKGRIVAV